MSATTFLFLVAAAAYLAFTLFRVLKLIWDQGAIGEEVDAGDALMIVFGDVCKLVKLPFVAFKAFRKERAPS